MRLSGFLPETLGESADTVLYRGRTSDDADPVLVVAPKSAHSRASARRRLERERALSDLLDPAWAAQPLSLEQFRNRTVLVLRDPGGVPLSGLLGKPLDLPRVLEIAVGLAESLRKVHERGLLHLDIRPDNVLVGDLGVVHLLGFGHAAPAGADPPPAIDDLSATPDYMAPEKSGRTGTRVDARSDLYSAGVILFEMLTGSLPFSGTDAMQVIHGHIARRPPAPGALIGGIPPMLDEIVLKLLAKGPADRYRTARSLERDLRRCSSALKLRGEIRSFQLGREEGPDRLRFPDRLYGRDADLERLAAAFERVSRLGASEFVLVSGHSGVGKTSLVEALRKRVAPDALFAAGKVSPDQRDAPYAAMSQALGGLMQELAAGSAEQVAGWREAMTDALGTSDGVMTSMVPEIARLIGERPSPPASSPQDDRERFHSTFRRFLGVFARRDRPLVLFIDDMHWSDAATLDLVRRLGTSEAVRSLLLVGAYRTDELQPSSGLRPMLEAVDAAKGEPVEIRLAPLGEADITRLVAETLRADPHAVAALSRLVFKKTQGNPFFAVQFLSSLTAEGLLLPDELSSGWVWDIERIRSKGIGDNVADLMAGELGRLGDAALDAMRRLACLGSVTPVRTLARVLGVSRQEVERTLDDAVSAGFVNKAERGYSFAHDRIREAAYALVPQTDRAAVHLETGRLLLDGLRGREREDNVFDIVNQLNRSVPLITSHGERVRLAELNLIAGKRAKAAAAHEAALGFLVTGREALPSNGWETQYRTAFELAFHEADCRYLLGDLDRAGKDLTTLSERCRSVDDLALVVGRRVIIHALLNEYELAIGLTLSCLEAMDCPLPLHPAASVLEGEYRRFAEGLDNLGGAEGLLSLPLMTDPRWHRVMDVLEGLLLPTGIVNPDLQHLVLLRMANISLAHGNTDESCHAYTNLGGFVLGWRYGAFEVGHGLGRVALRLVDEQGLDRYAARIFAVFSGTVGPWTIPLHQCHAIALRAIELGRQRGGVIYSGYSWGTGLSALLDSGQPLVDVHREAETGLAFARRADLGLIVEFLTAPLMLVRALRGLTAGLSSFDCEGFVADDYERRLDAEPKLWHAAVRYRIRKLQLLFYAGEYERCLQLVSDLEHQMDPIKVFEAAEYRFFSALTLAAVLSGDCDPDRRTSRLAMLNAHHEQLNAWAVLCPDNFADRACVVAAEIARLEGRELEAEHLYERAIERARDNGFLQNEALANELAARFHAHRGLKVASSAYLRNARDCYLRWGADRKVRQLDRLWPHIAADVQPSSVAAPEGIANLDLPVVVEMFQAVSREIVLESLIERLMAAVVRHAGAVRGLLLLARDGEFSIVAEAVTGADAVRVSHRHQTDIAREMPQSILNYVVSTREISIIDDATAPNAHAADPYIAAARPKSVLCVPLERQHRLVGVLYLENDLASHAFTAGRVSVLELIASQAAISIENAQLFRDVQRTQEETRRAVESLERASSEKDALLKEVHHRVKNNLQLISSMLNLQAGRVRDPAVGELFAETRSRVRSMALVHENLYRAGDFVRIPMGDHVNTLCSHLIRAYGPEDRNVRLETEIDEVQLDLDRAISSGLIINELVSNALKHAFPTNLPGRIRVRLKARPDGRLLLAVGDDGVGLPPEVDLARSTSVGLQLVQDLADQLHGSVEVIRDGGTAFEVLFGLDDPAGATP